MNNINNQSLVSFFIDRGGTFTDCLCVSSDGKEYVIKVLSENPHYSDSSLECVRLGLKQLLGIDIPRGNKLPNRYVEEIRIGTTIATNALLERQGTAFAFVTTKGFKDVLRIGVQSRPDIFDLKINKPEPLFDDALEIDERVVLVSESLALDENKEVITTSSGQKNQIRKELPSEEKLITQLQKLKDAKINNLAVAFLHAAVYPEHELRFGEIAKKMGFQVSLSHQAMPMVKIVSRGNTVCADAYLTPKIKKFVHSFLEGFEDPTSVNVLFMRSDGGLENARTFSGHRAILSGPAGGVNGFSRTAFSKGLRQPVVGFDMGGTSTDVSRFQGEFEQVFETTTAGITIQAPQLEINTVAAGGGSRLFFKNGLFQVGPESSGSKPGPVCYKHKGGLLSITDANIVLGRLVASEFPRVFGQNENEEIDLHLSKSAFENLIKEHKELQGFSTEELAMGFIKVANEAMCRPIREMTMMRGFDVQDHILASFGGAGGQHACAVAKNLGIRSVKIHRYAGILSAVGLGLADIVQEAQEPAASIVFIDENNKFDFLIFTSLREKLEKLRDHAVKELETKLKGTLSSRNLQTESYFHLRYSGTETTVPISSLQVGDFSPLGFKNVFESMHRREYGFVLENRSILCDDIRVKVKLVSKFSLEKMDDTQEETNFNKTFPPVFSSHPMYIEGVGWVDTPIFKDSQVRGHIIEGPAIILQGISTIIVEPDCRALVNCFGDVNIQIGKTSNIPALISQTSQNLPSSPDPIQLSLYSHRFMSIAEQMGKTLRKTAVSVNIKERLDFSCAIFGPDAGLVVVNYFLLRFY